MNCQPGILAEIPPLARFLFLNRLPEREVSGVLQALAESCDGDKVILGIGAGLAHCLGRSIAGLRGFQCLDQAKVLMPSTPYDLLLWIRGDDAGELHLASRRLLQTAAPAFELVEAVESFKYREGRDLTGYDDGTENPTGEDAIEAAVVADAGAGLDGSSFLALQKWRHDLTRFETHSQGERDNMIGRRLSDNEELDDAPETAHVKRTAQESFSPEAFVLRRSMPWARDAELGLVFAAFGHSFDAFEALLGRMAGVEDGLVDALFSFTRPESGCYFWCPPVVDGHIDVSALI